MGVPLLDGMLRGTMAQRARRDPFLSADAGRAGGMAVLRSRAGMWKLALHP
jgi:hypothetical protein